MAVHTLGALPAFKETTARLWRCFGDVGVAGDADRCRECWLGPGFGSMFSCTSLRYFASLYCLVSFQLLSASLRW